MKQTNRLLFTTLIVLLTLLANLVTPVTVFADEGTPPPATEEPVVVEEELTVAEVFEQLPEDTQIVVINEEGSLEPLAAEEAVTIIAEGDPMWCPAANTTVTADCVNALTVTDLLPLLASKDEAGIIYFYTPVTYNTNDVTFDGTNPNIDQLKDNSLTLQGGWNGTTTLNSTITFSGNSVFSVPVTVTNWTANVTINNITVDGATTGDGITVMTTGNISLMDVKSNNNTSGSGAYLDNTFGTGNITLTGTNEFNLNNRWGLQAASKGDITLNNITANENKSLGGAYLYNVAGSGNITLNGTNTFNLNYETGLTAASSTGDITINNITANGNKNFDGAFLVAYGTGDITLTGTNKFNGNYYSGLVASSNAGNITINNITANENLNWDGVSLDAFGNITLTGTNEFNGNYWSGLEAFSSRNITVNNITANGNKNYDGAYLDNSYGIGSITLSGTTVFNLNNRYGLEAYSDSDITINNVTAASNAVEGLYLDAPQNITITCDSIYDNGGYGLNAILNGVLTLNGVTFANNTSGDLLQTGGTLVENSTDCAPAGSSNKTIAGLPLQIVRVSGGSAELDCVLFSGTVLILPNGDQVIFKCPTSGSASLNPLTNDALPGALPEGVEYVSGMLADQSPVGSDTALDGLVVVSFLIPAEFNSASLAILYWTGSEWVDLKDATFEDGRSVINGGYMNGDAYFEALTNFGGRFVLVSK